MQLEQCIAQCRKEVEDSQEHLRSIEIFVQTITVGWQAIAAKCRDGQKSSASGMMILN